MAIDYSRYTSPRLQDVYSQNGGALPEGFDKGAFYKNFNINYDPNAYGDDMGAAIRAWIEAGRPDIDRYGNELDTRGQFITNGFGVPTWAQGNPNPTYSGGTPVDGYLQKFAQNRPWASQYVNDGGYEYLGSQLRTISQDDFSRYSPEDQELIRNYLSGKGYKPGWAAGNTWSTGTGTGAPGAAPNRGMGPAQQQARPGVPAGAPGASTYNGAPQVGTIPGLQGQASNPLGRQNGNPSLGSFGGNRRPRGYEGY